MEHPSVTLFRDYLKIKSVQPDPDYDGIVKFLEAYAQKNDFACKVLEPVAGKPIVVLTVEGYDPSLPTILLNSHTDVVPVFPEHWTYDPFSAHKTEDGKIYARGSQDMKCVGIQHLEALRMLREDGVKLKRTIHISFVPDEEIGGGNGMNEWIKTDHFKSLNVGFALDEGLANPGDEMRSYYSERTVYWGSFVAEGMPGHGSQFLKNTAGPKIHKVMGKILQFRDQQESELNSDSSLTIGDVSTINITALNGGVQPNVCPSELSVGFDLRITPHTTLDEIDTMLDQWCTECDVSIRWTHKQLERGVTSTDPSDPYWKAFSSALEQCEVKYTKEVFPAGTDSRYLRNLGLPAIGFSPMNHTPVLLHDHNEFLDEKIFIRGLDIFKKLIDSLANSP